MPLSAGPDAASLLVCPWCGRPTPPDYAHGHLQCLHCKTNIAPCCDGETACEAAEPDMPPPPA